MAKYVTGDAKQIIVGAAAFFVARAGGELVTTDLPAFVRDTKYADTLSDTAGAAKFRNVGYTTNGLDMTFTPDFGEVQVDQLLDSAKLFKQGMQVSLKTAFAEATLENLLVAIAAKDEDLVHSDVAKDPFTPSTGTAEVSMLDLKAGELGECPLERGIIAVGPGTGDCTAANGKERIYAARRALSMESVTVSAKRDAASVFEVSFRLLPNSNGSYGVMVDRTLGSPITTTTTTS